MERYTKKQYSIRDYYDLMCSVGPAVESLTSREWHLEHDLEINEALPMALLRYDFMVYLRHLGFPSPLLDWSRSPYVAAFFAFRSKPDAGEENVAIYSYVEYYGGGKTWSEAALFGIGPYVTAHRRHYTQQCEYTICKKGDGDKGIYWNHEETFQGSEPEQDLLTKYLIPTNERARVLDKLHIMNINAYSLFGHDESLMETLAYQEIERKGREG